MFDFEGAEGPAIEGREADGGGVGYRVGETRRVATDISEAWGLFWVDDVRLKWNLKDGHEN